MSEFDAAIKVLGDQIVGLTLLQAKSLADYLKEVHGIEAAGGAVMMAAPAGGGGGGAGESWRRECLAALVPCRERVGEFDEASVDRHRAAQHVGSRCGEFDHHVAAP